MSKRKYLLKMDHLLVGGLILIWCLLALPENSDSDEWLSKKNKHFNVFYREDSVFAAETLGHAERYYSMINAELGLNHVVKRDRIAWLGDKRCRLYLYPDKEEYLDATHSPEWSAGKTSYGERIIWSFTGSDEFLESVLPHELAHILFREYVGFDNARVPLWLDEGVAQYAEIDQRDAVLSMMKGALQREVYIPLEEIGRVRLRAEDETGASLFYVQSFSMVYFLIREYGSGRFIQLCSALRDGKTLERALSSATSGSLGNVEKFEQFWKSFVLREG